MEMTTAPIRISDVTGDHLTAADKRNLKALLDIDGFTFGESYKVNGRKVYAVTQTDGRYAVTIRENEIDGFGRKITRTYRSEFAA